MTEAPTVILYLAVPPTTNGMWRHAPNRTRVSKAGKRYSAPVTLSDAYIAWLDAIQWPVALQMRDQSQILGHFRPVIRYPESAHRDEDSWIKPLLDGLQRNSVVRDDKGARGLTMVFEPRKDVCVELYDLGGDPLPIPKARRYVREPRPSRPTAAAIRRFEQRGRRLPI